MPQPHARTHARRTTAGQTNFEFFTSSPPLSLHHPIDQVGTVTRYCTVVDVRLDLEYKPRTVLLPVPRTLRSSARTVYPIDRYSTTSRTTVQYCMTVDEVGSSRTVVSSLVLVLVPVPSVMSHDVMIERRQSDNQVGEQTRKDLSLCTLHVV